MSDTPETNGCGHALSGQTLFGLVCFEESGMPWTRIQGIYQLLRLDNGENWGGEPHWQVKLENGNTCFVPENSVVIVQNTQTRIQESSRDQTDKSP